MKKFAALLLALGTVAGTAVAANAQGYYVNLNNPYYTHRDWQMRHRAFHRVYDRNRDLRREIRQDRRELRRDLRRLQRSRGWW